MVIAAIVHRAQGDVLVVPIKLARTAAVNTSGRLWSIALMVAPMAIATIVHPMPTNVIAVAVTTIRDIVITMAQDMCGPLSIADITTMPIATTANAQVVQMDSVPV
jgi:hypothetical protein